MLIVIFLSSVDRIKVYIKLIGRYKLLKSQITETKNRINTDSIRKLSNFNYQRTKTLYQNNLNNIAFFFTFFKGYRYLTIIPRARMGSWALSQQPMRPKAKWAIVSEAMMRARGIIVLEKSNQLVKNIENEEIVAS